MADAHRPSDPYLDRIQTLWTLVQEAHRPERQHVAQEQLLERYREAVHRYLLGAVRDPHEADELFQEFAVRFLEGKFRGANPEKGRFRDYVKSALFNLVSTYRRKSGRQPVQAESFVLSEAPSPDEDAAEDAAFRNQWRDQLLASTWERLAESDRQTGSHGGTILRFKSQHPELDSQAVAHRMTEQLARPFTAASIRQAIHRAREKFAELLREEIARSINSTHMDAIDQEAAELGLLAYCGDTRKS
jgi:RNA polymerase sigma factor (sigma-70 family)